jgi:uncharacterized membrane protein
MNADFGMDSTRLERLLKISLGALVSVLLFSGIAYISVFNGGLSSSENKWSAFGSFFGGVLGPAVSLVTLCAILITIDLQKKMLRTQQHEFQELSALQALSHQVQVDQSNFARVADYKLHQMQLLDQQITMFERMLDRYNVEAERIFELGRKTGVPRVDKLEEMDRDIQSTELSVGRLIQLSVEVSLREFESTDQISALVRSTLEDIQPNLYKLD